MGQLRSGRQVMTVRLGDDQQQQQQQQGDCLEQQR
jgi:hypothetical protein